MEKTKVKTLVRQIRGVSYKPEDLHNELDDNSVVLLRANNIDEGKINFDDVVYVDKSKVSDEQYLKYGDILICASSGSKNLVGKAASIRFNTECTFGAFCKVIRPKEGLDEYLSVYFQSPIYRRKISEVAIGVNINNIRNEHIDELDIPVFLNDEQASIVKKIHLIQEVISNRKAELEKLDDLIKARFVEMFGNGHDGFCNTKRLGEFCKFQQGTQVPVEEQIEEQLEGYTRFLRIIDYTQAPQIPRYVSVKGRKIAEDSVVIVRYGATAGFVGHGYAGILANNLFEVVPDESILSKDFLYLALKYGTFEQEVHDKAFGAAMPALSFGMMNDIGVVTPNVTAQNSFVDFVHQVDKSKVAVQKTLEQTQTLFDSLMQKYFG